MEKLAIFKIEDLTYYYPETEIPAINKINLQIEEGEFLLIVGPSGCGKSTLARVLSGFIPSFYGGSLHGQVYYKDRSIFNIKRQRLHREIGLVFQNPERQLIMGNTEREIAFGMENLGIEPKEIARKIVEVASFLGLSELKERRSWELSSGEKQKLVIGAILAMTPQVLILDEPTSQLDPLSAEEILHALRRLSEELGYTIILIEHRLERCFHFADRIILLEEGEIKCDAPPGRFSKWAIQKSSSFIPPVSKFFAKKNSEKVPLTVQEGRTILKNKIVSRNHPIRPNDKYKKEIIKTKDLYYSYNNGTEALRGINLGFSQGEFNCILGENGAGKTTFLKLLIGILKPNRGKLFINNNDSSYLNEEEIVKMIGYLSQNPNDYLFNESVEGELKYTMHNFGLTDYKLIDDILNILDISQHKIRYPRELSTGERQRIALATVMVTQPDVLLLDEPTRGLDCELKTKLGKTLQALAREDKKTIILVTHDIEFASEFADRVILLSAGQVIAEGDKYEVLKDNLFYSSQVNKLFRGIADDIISIEDTKTLSLEEKNDG